MGSGVAGASGSMDSGRCVGEKVYFSHHVVLQGVDLRVVVAQQLVVVMFGRQRVVDVQGVVFLGRGLHRLLQFILGIGIILT